jgi:hypothetical protein
MQTLNAEQLKELKRTLFLAKSDWQYVSEPLIQELRKAGLNIATINASLRASAALALWLALTDKCAAMGHDVPEYKDSTGLLRSLVDAEAAGVAQQVRKAA